MALVFAVLGAGGATPAAFAPPGTAPEQRCATIEDGGDTPARRRARSAGSCCGRPGMPAAALAKAVTRPTLDQPCYRRQETPAATQPPGSRGSADIQDQLQAPAPSPAELARIRRALMLDRQGTVQTTDLDFREEVLTPDERPRITWPSRVDLVSGVDLFSHVRPPAPRSVPGHWDMMAAMTPREITEARSTDVLGIVSATAVTAAAFKIVPAIVNKIGGWFSGDGPRATPTYPILTGADASVATTGMTANDSVVDADIDQRGRIVILSLVVPPDTSEDAARTLGERFVRLVKTLARGEPNPGADLGAGAFDYIVQVRTPADGLIVRGGKALSEPTIRW